MKLPFIVGCSLLSMSLSFAEDLTPILSMGSPNAKAWVEQVVIKTDEELKVLIRSKESDEREVKSWILAMSQMPENRQDLSDWLPILQDELISDNRKALLQYSLGFWVKESNLSILNEFYLKKQSPLFLEMMSLHRGVKSFEHLWTQFKKNPRLHKQHKEWLMNALTQDCKPMLIRELKSSEVYVKQMLYAACQMLKSQEDPFYEIEQLTDEE